ncbi:hypothetical protein [Pseudophaeobacter sp.]|uniref:hypothetical protein n=1 Tax=Pseudophaeobacter sp. TaxID=1971739 RepID=UPI0025D6EE24|nr:hypothetical protein [uncultured Pseudophaeobacter sp.]
MADVDKIVDLDQLETWLQTQDVRISRAIAARASLRSLPTLMAVSDQIINKTAGAELLLAGLRATLISGVASTCPTPDMKRIEAAARSAALSSAARSARSAARSAAANAAANAAVFSDAKAAKNGDPHQIFTGALWPRPQGAENLLTMWETFAALHDPTGIWTFWRDWYRGMLTGAPMDWDLQLQVALIKDEIWEAGPEDVAKEIERIQAKFELEQEVKRLKEELTALKQATSSPLIGDNGGPPLDALPAKAFKKDILLLWDDLDTLEAEIATPAPSPAILKRIAKSLSEIAMRIAAYCGATLDVAIKAGAKTIGAATGGLVVADYVQPETIQAAAQAITKFLATLP